MAESFALLQWVKFGPVGTRPEVYLNGPELADLLRQEGHEGAAEVIEGQVQAIEQQRPSSQGLGWEGPS